MTPALLRAAQANMQGGKWGAIVTDELLLSTMERLLADASERERYAALGLQRAQEYGVTAAADRYLDIFGRITDR